MNMNINPILIRRMFSPALLLIFFTACKLDNKPVVAPVDTSTVNIRLPAAPTSVNPLIPTTAYSTQVAQRVFQTLGELDPTTLEMKPVLVKNIPVVQTVADGPHKGCLSYTFEIYDEATWDNGTPVTANDVIFTLKLIYLPALTATKTYLPYFDNFKTLEVDPANPKKFTVYFTKYYMMTLETLCQTPIYPAYNYDPNKQLEGVSLDDLKDPKKQAQLSKNPNLEAFAKAFQEPKYSNDKNFISGSGPYRLESMDGDQGTVLIKKENWWGDKLAATNPMLGAYPKKLDYKVVKDELAIENMLRNSNLDVADNMAPENFLRLSKDPELLKQYDFKTQPIAQYAKWMFNNRNPKLADARVRQALAYLVDYDYILNTVLQGLGQRTVGPVPPFKSFYAKNLPLRNFNVGTASTLLKSAGWEDTDGDGTVDKVINGKKTQLTLDILAPTSIKVGALISQALKESARQGGVNVNVIPMDLSLIHAETKKGNYETAFLAQALFPGLTELHQAYHSASLPPIGDNRCRFSNARADSVIMAIRSTPDTTLRKALYIKAQEVLQEQTPEVVLYFYVQRFITAKKFDYVISPNRSGYEYMFKPRK